MAHGGDGGCRESSCGGQVAITLGADMLCVLLLVPVLVSFFCGTVFSVIAIATLVIMYLVTFQLPYLLLAILLYLLICEPEE